MSLQDLYKHIPAQEKAIGEASSGFKPVSTDAWVGFRDSLWGKPIESFEEEVPVERDRSDPVAEVALPDKHFVVTFPEAILKIPWAWKSKRILVRFEYNEAEQAAVLSSSSNCNVFVVTGQPGIGKSVFLIRLLMRRLALKLPTALQIHSSYAILFHEGGVFEFKDPKSFPDYYPLTVLSKNRSSRIWALVDPNPDLLEPFSIFKHSSSFFVIDAASPRSEHLKWLKKVSHDYFYMRLWSDSEVLQACSFLGRNHTERQVWHLHKKFGASPRDLAGYAGDPDRYIGLLIREIAAAYPLSHRLLVTEPSRDNRRVPKIAFASQEVFDLLWSRYLRNRTAEMAYYYSCFCGTIGAASSARWLFEARIHQLLTRGKTIQIFPILGHRAKNSIVYSNYDASRKQKDPVSLQWASSEQCILPEDNSVKLQEGHYYRLDSTNFPTISSLLLFRPPDKSPPILLIFRISQDQEEHDVNPKDLRRVNSLKFPSDTRKCYVAVTPGGTWPRITIPMERFQGQPMSPDKFLPVFHLYYPVPELFKD